VRAPTPRARLPALAACLALATAASAAELPALQPLVDATPEGGVLRPPPGVYSGPVVVRRPIRIEGGGHVTIDAGGKGSVIRLLTDGAAVVGLRLTGSGDMHDTIDSGVQVRGNGNEIADNVIEDCLFGVDLQQSDGNVVRANRISSKDLEMGVRGDAIRLWYSRENEILDNEISDVRDMVVWYSGANVIADNRVTGSRYALHFMYSEANRVERNRYIGNMVGVFLMYSDGVVLRDNVIRASLGATGMGVGFKESSRVLLEGNEIIYCSRGIYLDISPYEPDTVNRFIANRIGYNGIGVVFHSDWHGNVFRDNDFVGNFSQVAVRGGGSAMGHIWDGNHWDDYRGFDRNRDGRGDTPFLLYAYSDLIWQEIPPAAFFRGSPLFEAIDFLDRLAPFLEPTLVLRDESPRLDAEARRWPM
jgi:nitrous oxidase accessory protein